MHNQFENLQPLPEKTREKIKEESETKKAEPEKKEKSKELSYDIFKKRMRGEGKHSHEKIDALLRSQGIKPWTPEAQSFMAKWDWKEAQKILEEKEKKDLFGSILKKLEEKEREGKLKISRIDNAIEVEIISHIAKKKKISTREAAKWFVEHWAEICRRHIERYYSIKKIKE